MRILVGKHSGFCFGVRRAVDLAKHEAERGSGYTYGNIIHNESVIEELRGLGIAPVDSIDSLTRGETLIIRAHGVPQTVYEEAELIGVRLVDATCPFVRKIHMIVKKASQEGRKIFIAGKADHPEVIGIKGHAVGEAVVLENENDAERVGNCGKACVVAQTTLARSTYKSIVETLKKHVNDLDIMDTICDTTRFRQSETEIIAKQADKVIVFGSGLSANTARLAEIAQKSCENVEIIGNIDKFSLANLGGNDIIGIVAGASTPDPIIWEVIKRMSELEKTTIETIEAVAPAEEIVATEPAVNAAVTEAAVEEKAEEATTFAEAFEKTLTRIHNGQLIKGTVLSIVDGEVYVNVGYKADGIIPKDQFSADADADPAELYKEGDEIEVEVLKVNDGEGNVLLSRKNVESKKVWDELLGDENVEGKVFDAVGKEVVKGGLIADINGIRAFVPASQVALKYTENLNEFVGQPMKVEVLEVDKSRKRIVASRKKVLAAEAKTAKKEKWNTLEAGTKVNGVVRRITDFGAFVDIGGIDGLVHVTDVAWGRVKHPSDVLSIGQEIEVLILNVDAEKERVSLGYKQLQPKPWTYADQKYPVGSIVEGKVVRIVPFGAFVALESTIDGLIHISQVGVHRIEKVEDEINVGDVVRCKVLEVNTEAKRISLSRKEALIEEDPAIKEQLEAERAQREAQRAERQEQRAREREQQQASQQQRQQRQERSARPSNEDGERRERSNRRRSSEDGEYELPPVQTASTSLADLFAAFKTED